MRIEALMHRPSVTRAHCVELLADSVEDARLPVESRIRYMKTFENENIDHGSRPGYDSR